MAKHIETGKKGEQVAVNYLKTQGYKILEVNWRFHHLEIDIIAKKDNMIIIVEVKSRTTDYFGFPEEAVNKRKQQYLINATDNYLTENNLDLEVRYDVISIVFENNKQKLYHIEDAFIPGL
jgi:putative endonuclease